ncbi:hypothetical protein [Micromonospora sp. CPCC 206061]|uniref:hypothetical protein n=1 Tax=Micromonospora sp. CPCC 206061 TaxID=3122410 RepID=UPI002FEECC53
MGGASVGVNTHVYPQTVLFFRSYPAEERVTVHIGEGGADTVLFLRLAEIDRLSAVLDQARQSLQVPATQAAA